VLVGKSQKGDIFEKGIAFVLILSWLSLPFGCAQYHEQGAGAGAELSALHSEVRLGQPLLMYR
jgi:hypothetical protein